MNKQSKHQPGISVFSSLSRFASAIATGKRRLYVRTAIAIVALPIFLMPYANAQRAAAHQSKSITIRGTVLNSANESISDASVELEPQGVAGLIKTKTDSAGAFLFTALPPGSYKLIAKKSALVSLPVTVQVSSIGDENKINLTLEDAKASSPPARPAMEFADQPNFTVAGVTDWTAVGGHGSDAILRTSETLARETITLKPDGSKPPTTAGTTGPAEHSSEYDLALASRQAGDLKKAREHLQKLLAVKETPDACRLAGEVDEQLGDPLAAVHEFEHAVRLDPSEQNYFEWGSELLLHRAVWQAREVFAKGVEAYPKSARMMTALGAALFAGARYDEAALRLCEASDLNPADPEPYAFIGKIELVAPAPLPCVEQKLAQFAQRQPHNAQANYLYAMAIWKRQQQPANEQALQQMEALLTKSVAIDPKYGDAYLQLGILYSSERNIDKAIDFYLKAIEANPQLGEAHYRLGIAYDRMGEAAKAKREFQLHDEIEKQQADAIESQRREVKQFLVVLQGQPQVPPGH